MVKNLTHFSLYLPSKGQFQEMDGEASHSVRYWLNREICNSARGAFDAPSTLAPRWPPKFPRLWPPQTPPPELIGDRG